ncbi:DUF6903 family protein [Amedibacterium intestinale]|jgi:hypothetical protein|uniref:Uncharacterized protein n=1 Tax=Amedibacterium intestinale TaxID=2583452 RepID=A0A6N4TMS9_9FIRM|nr:hypothetical protein [Amedibacterium intestinale]BBK23695.1 hypothetical protein Aargi30884_25980 [Amedibacterium intestinale]BBK63390.1 hypothetical protein A9CBEGH2_23300 [Amedibacterium intestinale]
MESNVIKNIIMAILFFVFLGMIIVAQRTVSLTNLGIEIVGLAGLLTLLYIYNRKYK